MKWAILNVDEEIEIRNCEDGIEGMELGSYYNLIEWVSMGMELENGMVMVKEGVVIVSGDNGEDIDLIKFRDI